MGADVEVTQSGPVGQGESERGLETALPASGFEDVGDGAGAEGVAFEGDVNGLGQLLGSVVVEQGEQPGGVRSQGLSALGESLEECGGGGDGGAQPVAGGVDVGLAGGGEQAFQMGGVLDGQSGVVGAVMVGQLGLSVEDADAGGRGEQGQRLSDVGVGDRVEIAVEADVGGLAGADGAHQVGLEGIGGQREQAGLLFGPDVGDAAIRLVGMPSAVSDLVSPASELGVDVVDVAEGAGGEVGVAQVLDLALDFSFLQSCRMLLVLWKRHRFGSSTRSIHSGAHASHS